MGAVPVRRAVILVAGLVAVGTLVAVGWPTAGIARGPTTYVALGDSYTSGPSVPDQLGPTTRPPAPAACLRSSRNYPSLVARALGLTLTDVSCAGATTTDLFRSQGAGVPAQLGALRPSTGVVTVGIGGNDLGFSSIAESCVALTPVGPTRVGLTCRDHYTAGGVDRLAAVDRTVGVRVARVLAAIRARAPGARVFVIGYPQLVPASGPGCWPSLPFTGTDVHYLAGVERGLNAALATAAARAGDRFVDMAGPSADHDACTPAATRWVEPLLATPGTYPLHPDATGMDGMAGVLEQAMARSGRI
jgi:lysophospholipase L1-like esterase